MGDLKSPCIRNPLIQMEPYITPCPMVSIGHIFYTHVKFPSQLLHFFGGRIHIT